MALISVSVDTLRQHLAVLISYLGNGCKNMHGHVLWIHSTDVILSLNSGLQPREDCTDCRFLPCNLQKIVPIAGSCYRLPDGWWIASGVVGTVVRVCAYCAAEGPLHETGFFPIRMPYTRPPRSKLVACASEATRKRTDHSNSQYCSKGGHLQRVLPNAHLSKRLSNTLSSIQWWIS